jgi:hypothetical protein
MNARTLTASAHDWQPAAYRFGKGSVYNGKPLVEEKVLSDRRSAGGGIAYLLQFRPPQGKLIKLIATAQSDEHVYILQGGYCNKLGKQLRFPGDYGLNAQGHNHSAFIGCETVALVVYLGEPDQVHECDVIDPEQSQEAAQPPT